MKNSSHRLALLTLFLSGLISTTLNAALTVIGTQYREDLLFPEFFCYYASGNYPSSCSTFQPGATVQVCVKNTGGSSETITDATLAGYSLATIIEMSTAGYNPDQLSSIYFYWDNPPQQVLDAGEPVWWKADPATVAAGAVAQVTVRLRSVPTNHVSFGVVSSSGTITTNITVDANAPRITTIGYSEDRKKVYLQWRRNGGAAPTSVYLNGTNVTSLTTTVGDTNVNFAASVISLSNALPFYSLQAYQGIYADGKTAASGQRVWTNNFIYCTWGTFEETGQYSGEDWVDEASAHGFNASEVNLGILPNDSYMQSHGYGYIILDKTKLKSFDPELWFINDEPDAEENNQGNTHCGTGTRIPCDSSKYAGTLVHKEAVNFANELHGLRPNVPITVNLDGGLQPQSWYTWGPAVDSLESNNYYEVRLKDAYLYDNDVIPLHRQPKLSYAVGRSGTEGASPNPFRHILYSCKADNNEWPYPFPESKHIEAYYSLAGGTKGFGYWWFNDPRGLWNAAQAPALWKEMGLLGNEVKTARRIIVNSTPVDLPLTPSTNVWARAMASGHDTLILYVVNDNFANDITGCHVTNVPDATVSATLPSWMVSSNTTVFEITTGGRPGDASWTLNGNQFTVYLGTLKLVRMIIITTDSSLRSTTESWYTTAVKTNLCSFAPEYCYSRPAITLQPVATNICTGATASFKVSAVGSNSLAFQWQRNGVNLGNGGHYSGVTTTNLTVSTVDANDAGNYRCVVSATGGSTNSTQVALTLKAATTFTLQPSATNVCSGANATFTVAATGDGTVTYQWQKNMTNLSNGGHYSGVTTATLTITGADANDAANYRCVATAGCGSSISFQAALTVGTTITTQPSPQTVCAGANATFSVAASGGGTLTYQWRTNGLNISNNSHYGGTTSATLTVTNAGSADTVNYSCVVSGSCGNATSSSAALSLGAAPSMTGQPSSQTVNSGATAVLTVTATGHALTYQWQKNGANLSNGGHYSGVTTASLTISNADANDTAGYRCVLSGCGSATSSTATLIVNTCIPSAGLLNAYFDDSTGAWNVASDWTSYSSGSGTFSKNTTIYQSAPNAQRASPPSSGAGAYSGVYQNVPAAAGDGVTFKAWCYNESSSTYITTHLGVKWDGTTSPPASFPTANNANGTWTQLTVAGQATSASGVTVFLHALRGGSGNYYGNFDTVDQYWAFMPPAPYAASAGATSLYVDPLPGCNYNNSSAQFAITIGGGAYTSGTHWVQANGTVSTTQVWQTDAQWAAITITGLSTGTNYTLKVKARYSSSITQESALGAGGAAAPIPPPPPSITGQPSAQNVCAGANAIFSVTAAGEGTLTYQWQTNSVNISNNSHYGGATSATLTVTNVGSADAVNYRCVVSNAGGSTNSSQAALTVKAATTITQQPANANVAPGGTTNFIVAATGDGALTYQWQKNQVNLSNGGHYSGCTTATLTISSADANDAANYRCVVTGGCGSGTSSEAALTISSCVPPAGLQNGYFDASTGSWTVATNWTSYSSGSSAFSKNTTIYQSSPNAQRVRPPTSGAGAYGGVYQNVAANQGDALTFKGWFYNESPQQYVKTHLGAKWDGTTTPPATFPTTNSANGTWTQLTVAGQASTANGVTVFLHVIRGTSGTYYVDYDSVDKYHAYVPPAPAVAWVSSTSLNVNADPGCNSSNTNAEYVISIGGGAYTLGTHFVQANGTVSTMTVWQTDATWGNRTVTGLSTGTQYTFQVKARHSSTVTQQTSLGASGTGTP